VTHPPKCASRRRAAPLARCFSIEWQCVRPGPAADVPHRAALGALAGCIILSLAQGRPSRAGVAHGVGRRDVLTEAVGRFLGGESCSCMSGPPSSMMASDPSAHVAIAGDRPTSASLTCSPARGRGAGWRVISIHGGVLGPTTGPGSTALRDCLIGSFATLAMRRP